MLYCVTDLQALSHRAPTVQLLILSYAQSLERASDILAAQCVLLLRLSECRIDIGV